jgi:putative copper export protein/streptogramin lyase/methionine-rich copper-binding protein CopC
MCNCMSVYRSFTYFHQGQRTWSPVVIFSRFILVLLPLIILLVLLPSAGDVLGHAFVLDSNPAPSESLEKSPARVEVFLSEPVDDRYSEVRVIGPDGNQVDNKDTQHLDGDQSTLGVTLPTEGLEDGVYTVSTKMLSQIDGHVTDDAFVFGVGESAPLSSAEEPGQSKGASTAESTYDQLSAPDAIARYPALVGQVIVVGSAFASLWLWKPFAKVNWIGSPFTKGEQGHGDRKRRRTFSQVNYDNLWQFKNRIDKRLIMMMLIGAAIVIVADFGMIYALAYSLSIGMFDAMTTKFGTIWFVRTCISFLLFAVILFVYLKVGRRSARSRKTNSEVSIGTNPLITSGTILKRELVVIMVIGIITLLTTSLMGHGAAMTTGAQIPITIDFVHNLAASVWIGGVFYLALVVVSSLRRDDKLNDRIKCSVLCIMIPRFSTIPVVVLGIIVITGPFLLYILEDDLNLTLASLYGKALIAKLVIAAIMLALGGYNQKVVHRNALDILTAAEGRQEQQVIISQSAESAKRSRSISASSSTPTTDYHPNDKKNVPSQNKLFLLLRSLRQTIVRSRPDRNRFGSRYVEGDGNSKPLEQHREKRRDGIGIKQGESSNAGDWSEGNLGKGGGRTITNFNRSIKIEAVLGILLLGAVAVLTNTGLPASEFQSQVQQIGEISQQTNIQNLLITTSGPNNGIGDQGVAGGYSATQYLDNATAKIKLSIDPFVVGNNNFEVEFLEPSGNPVDMRSAGIKLTQTEENIGPIEIQTNEVSEGVFTANASFGLAGPWDLLVEGVRNETNALNLVATFDLFVRPDLDQLEYSVTQIAMPDNRSQPLYPIYDSSRNSIWVGDTSLGSGRLFQYDITDREYREYRINGTNIITTMALDQMNDRIWFVDPISKVLGLFDIQSNSSQLYNFPNDRIVPSSIAVRAAEFSISGNTNANEDLLGGDSEGINRLGNDQPSVWITSPSTGEILIFDSLSQTFTDSLSLPTPNSNPLGIAIDSSTGLLWIAQGIGKIASIDPETNFTINEYYPGAESGGRAADTSLGEESLAGNDTLISPTALLIDPYTGNIYISEHDGHVVSVFNPVFGTFSDFPPIAEDALPFGMTLDKDRNLWVAQHVTNRITVIDPSSGKNKEVTIPSSSPFVQYLATDNEGRVWFAAQRGNAIGYITSTVNPMQGSQSEGLSSPSSSSSPSGVLSQEGITNESTATSQLDSLKTIFTPLFNIGYENLMGPLIAIGVVASSAFYVNSVTTLKSSIRKVNGMINSGNSPSSPKRDLSQSKNRV